MTLVLASLTIALIANTWVSDTWPPQSTVYLIRKRLFDYARSEHNRSWLRTLAGAAICRYCVSHWIGFAVVPWIAPWTHILPAIFLANIVMNVYGALGRLHN
jgi:hypothetical protein